MNQKVLVSVVMITYGHEKYIHEAIEGVLMQEGHFELELIVSNDCSPDDTDAIVQDILKQNPKASCISYFKHEKNMGMMPNFIFAMQQAKGKYIALCDGDDYWIDINKLQKQVDFLEANPDYVLSFHEVKILKRDGEFVDDFITDVPENYEIQETLARLGNYIHTPSVVFRNVIKEFPPEFSYTPVGDYFLFILLSEYGKLKYLEDEMSVYREGVGIWSATSEITRHSKTALMNALLYKYFICNNNMLISNILHIKIKNYFYELQTNNIFHDKSMTNAIKAILYEGLLMEIEYLKSRNVRNVAFRVLLKTIIQRIKMKLWR